MMLRQGLVIIAMGVVIGVVLAAASSQIMSDLLVGHGAARPVDPRRSVIIRALIALASGAPRDACRSHSGELLFHKLDMPRGISEKQVTIHCTEQIALPKDSR